MALSLRRSARLFRFSAICSDSLRRLSISSRKPVSFGEVKCGAERVAGVVELEIQDPFRGVRGFVDVASCERGIRSGRGRKGESGD
jgi:hypothetical protein